MVLAGIPGTPSGIRLFDVVDVSRAKGVRPLRAEVPGTFAESRGSDPFGGRCQSLLRRGCLTPIFGGAGKMVGGYVKID